MPNNAAFVVGVDHYPFGELRGCVNDARAVGALLMKNHDGSANFDVRIRLSGEDNITRVSLRKDIEELFSCRDMDVALLYFAGHGTETNLGGYLVTPDAKAYDEGVALTDVLTWANQSKARERVIILDSCMSGSLGTAPVIGSEHVLLSEGVSILAAARSGQSAKESGGRGVFTGLVCGALEGGAADVMGNVSAPAIYSYVAEALGPFDQRPMFAARLSRVTPLRVAAPAVPRTDLLLLTSWFATATSDFALDPSYEDTIPGFVPEHVATFKKLQRCRDAKLVEAVGEEYLYFAAKNSTACRLTKLGQHYWRLVEAGRL